LETSVRNLCQGLKEPSSESHEAGAKASEEEKDLTSLELYHKFIYHRIETNNPPLVKAPPPAEPAADQPAQPVTMLTVKKKKKKSRPDPPS